MDLQEVWRETIPTQGGGSPEAGEAGLDMKDLLHPLSVFLGRNEKN